MMGHLNSFSASGGGNLNNNFSKNTNARGLPGGGGMLKLRFDWYIRPEKQIEARMGFTCTSAVAPEFSALFSFM